MIIQFDDNSYVEISKRNGNVSITIAGSDSENSKTVIVNSAEVTEKEFKELISDIIESDIIESDIIDKPVKKKKTSKKKATKK